MKSKILMAILVCLLVILVVSTGIPAGGKAGERGQGTGGKDAKALPNVEQDVEKLTFIHYESSTPPPWIMERWDDSEDDYMLIAGGINWPDTISYEVNPDGSGLTESEVLTAFGLASEEWDGWVDDELFNDPTQTSETDVGRDNHNRVLWADLQGGVIAVCHLWYVPPTKTILEFDIEFNTDYDWAIGAGETEMDVQNIGTHELGHGAGLNDLRPPRAWKLTMYQYSWEEDTGKSTLGCGDTLGIQKLYGPGNSWGQ